MICDQEFFKWSIQHCSELSLWNHSFNEWFTNFVVFTLIDYSLVYLWSKWLPRWLVNENMLLAKCILEWNGGSLSSYTVQYKTIGLTLPKCILEWWLTIKLHMVQYKTIGLTSAASTPLLHLSYYWSAPIERCKCSIDSGIYFQVCNSILIYTYKKDINNLQFHVFMFLSGMCATQQVLKIADTVSVNWALENVHF